MIDTLAAGRSAGSTVRSGTQSSFALPRRETAIRSPLSRSAAEPRVMLLTSGLGTGHTRAAVAVARAVEADLPGAQIQCVDFWSLIDPSVARAIQQTYLRLVTAHPELYQSLYRLDQHTWRKVLQDRRPPPDEIQDLGALIVPLDDDGATGEANRSWFDRFLHRELASILTRSEGVDSRLQGLRQLAVLRRCWTLLANRLGRRIRGFAPDVAVATQVNMAALTAHLKSRGKIDAPLVGVLTDYGVHDFWRQEGIDVYCVAEASMCARLRPSGVRVTGAALMPEYSRPPAASESRRRLGLPPDRPVLLVLGGGLGIGVVPVVRRLCGSALVRDTKAIVVAVAGGNPRLRQELENGDGRRLVESRRLRIDGWVESLVHHMRAADLVIGKPGGLTTAEVLACGRPLLSTCSLRGQESFNVRFLERNGVGELLAEDELPARVATLLEDRTALAEMQARAWRLGDREGAAQVAKVVLERAGARAASATDVSV